MKKEHARPLDDMLLETDIRSKEGVGVDQMTRSRLSFLTSQHTALLRQIQIADTKAGAILAVLGVFGAQIVTSNLGINDNLYLMIICLSVIVVVLCLAVVIPRFYYVGDRSEMHETDRFSFSALANDAYTADDHAAFMRTSQASQLIMSIARTNSEVAHVLATKFKILRWTFALAILDMGFILISASDIFVVRS